jgi:hypothetical protein
MAFGGVSPTRYSRHLKGLPVVDYML